MTQRTLEVEGLANARDLGGIPRSDGSLTPTGVFFRSDNLDRVGTAGWDRLRDHGITTIVDLRRPDEASGAVPPDIAHLRVDLDGDEREFWDPIEADGRWGTPLYYLSHLESLPHPMAGVLAGIAAADPGGVLFHCAGGWDRTGFVSAFLLRAAGVPASAATMDYMQSFANASAFESLHGRSSHVEMRREIARRWGHTPETAFAEMFESLDVHRWFGVANVDEATRRSILSWRGSFTPVKCPGIALR
ncbi:MAG: tyrosine-protein phosphatase [Actinomycetota bacterium]|nr:tyrosine-protein phosphatase [Actinomycetota bacterium]